MSFSFDSNNGTNNTGGVSFGLGQRRNSIGGPTSKSSGGLFGNTQTNSGSNTGNLFGTSSNTTTGGLFGNSQSSNTGGLFGNSQNNSSNNASINSNQFGNTQSNSTGLFGSTNNNANSNTGGLFGSSSSNSNTNTGGLFGSSNTSNNTNTGGLFGSSSTNNNNTNTGGLFGSSNTTSNTNTGGLFGSSNTSNNTNTGGLFGSTTANNKPSGLFGSSNTNTNTTANSGGLFGSGNANTGLFASNTSSNNGGLFGSSNSSNLFGNTSNTQSNLLNSQAPSTNLTVNNSNPYSYSQVLSNLQTSSDNMPESITTTIFSDAPKASNTPHKPKSSSLLGKLGQTFRLLRNTASNPSLSSLRGLFTSSDSISARNQQKTITSGSKDILAITSSTTTPKALTRPSYKSLDARRVGSMKRLIIKSKPVKYHLIDVNKVFNSKKKKVILNQPISSDKILQDKFDSDEDLEDDDEEIITDKAFARFRNNGVETDLDKKSTIKVESIKEPESTFNETDLHDGYWSTPTISEISNMTNDQLSSLDNLIVGRVGCGQIAYNFPVDLTKIVADAKDSLEKELFGKIIQIGNKMVITYKDCANKPPMGHGLNVPATITLENVKPKENVSIDDHIKFLKKQVGMEFVTYDPITHIWVFKVRHFSIWGLVSDEDEELQAMKRKQDTQEEEASLEYSKLYENEKLEQELKKQKLNEQTKIVPGGWEYSLPATENPINIKRKLVSEEIINELTKYKNDQSANLLSEQVSDITIDSDRSTPEIDDNDVDDDDDVTGVVDYMKQLANYLPPGTNLNELVDEKAYEPEISNELVFDSIQANSNLPTSDNWLLQLELANQLNSALAPLERPVKGKITMEKVDDFLFSDFNKNSVNMSTPTKAKISNNIEEDIIYTDNIPIIFHKLLNNSKISRRKNEFPQLQVTTRFQFKDLSSDDEDEYKVFSLLSSLFDTDDNKLSFGDWLKSYNASSTRRLLNENEDDPLEQTFIHLCAGDLIKAIDTAIAANNNHLSVIVTLSASNDEVVKSIANNQLISWKEQEVISLIPKPVIKIYQLLARDLDELIGDLPWNVALAMKLFYGDSQDIKLLLEEFRNKLPKTVVTDVLKFYIEDIRIENTLLNDKLKWFTSLILNQYSDSISKLFGDYLTEKNYWKEGIIVYSVIQNDNESKQNIETLIRSNIEVIIEKDSYLSDVLRIPRTVVYEALANDKRDKNDYWGEVDALLTVNSYEKAHKTIVTKLGPSTVISNSSQEKRLLSNIFEKFPQHGLIISDWNTGAGIYQNYLTLDPNDIEVLRFLLNNIPLTKYNNTTEEKIALNIISKTIGNLLIENNMINTSEKQKIVNLSLNKIDLAFFNNRLSNLNR